MISLQAFSATLSHDPLGLTDRLPRVRTIGLASGGRTRSIAADYADQAFRALPTVDCETALVCLCGPTGPMVRELDGARRSSPDGRLTGPGFAARSKRIHPFTLLRSLANSVCATLSTSHGLEGEYLNAIAQPSSLYGLLPQIEDFLGQVSHVVLVMASAGEQEEEGAKRRARRPDTVGIEGAICFLLGQEPGIGSLHPTRPGEGNLPPAPEAPALSAGLGILRAIADGADKTRIELVDGDGTRAAIEWRRH